MTLSPEATQALYADPSGQSLAEQLTAAYQRNVEGGVATPTIGDSLLEFATAAVAEATATEATRPEAAPLAGLSPEFGDLLASKFHQTDQLLDRIGIAMPQATEFARAGFDFPRLNRSFETMTALGLQPELVLAPVLPQEQWVSLFQELQNDPSVNHGHIKAGGLYIDSEVSSHWDELEDKNAHTLYTGGQGWQVLVLPGTDRPPILNVDHHGSDGTAPPSAPRKRLGRHTAASTTTTMLAKPLATQATNQGLDPESLTADDLHPTISAYLTLQAAKLQADQPPLDASSTYSWLHGTFGTGNLQAPYGHWDPGRGRVVVSRNGVGGRFDSLGVRLPVWGE
jgi:hypothetical protein